MKKLINRSKCRNYILLVIDKFYNFVKNNNIKGDINIVRVLELITMKFRI